MMPFPLPPGARPLWGMRDQLIRIQRHRDWGHPGAPLPAEEVLGWVFTLRLLAGLALWQERTNSTTDAYHRLQVARHLPLVWSAPQVAEWERHKPWRFPAYGLYSTQVSAYADRLESEEPSLAYVCDETTSPVWHAWLKQVSVSDWVQLLETSASHWANWLYEVCPEPPALLGAWRDMGARWGLSGPQAGAWATFETIAHAPLPQQADAWMHALEAIRFDRAAWVQLLNHALMLDPKDGQALWSVESVLRPKVLPAEDPAHLQPAFSAVRSWRDFKEQWHTDGWIWLKNRMWHHQSTDFHRLFPVEIDGDEEAQDPATLVERWPHLRVEFNQAVTALRQKEKAPAILIVGPAGYGKTALAIHLVLAAGRRLLLPRVNFNHAQILPRNQTLSALAWAGLCLEKEDPSVLVLDGPGAHEWEAEEVNVKRLFESRWLPLIATVSDLSKVKPAVVRRFDKVIVLQDWPVAQRLALARQHFDDEGLALRVARAIRTPDGIIGAAKWCTHVGVWDWATVQSHRQALDRGMRGDTAWEEPVDLDQGAALPPWAGYAHLNAVADRLCRAFENPLAYAKLGGRPPRGAILKGPPGNGKTLFVRHLAQRLNVPLLAPNVGPLVEKPERLRTLFQQARRMAPCLVLLDEAGPLVTINGKGTEVLLSELDGADPLEGVLVIATLNGGMLSPAIVRPGRLAEVHHLDDPEPQDRDAIWRAYLAPLTTEPLDDAAWGVLVHASRGFTGAEIAECVSRAGSETISQGETRLTLKRLTQACDAVFWDSPTGQSGGHEEEQWKTAVHEAGHALVAWCHGLDVQRITVRPRASSLGMVAWDWDELTHSLTRSKLHGEVSMALGGIAAEQVMFDQYSTGGSSDLQHVHAVLRNAITRFGFGHLGPVAAGAEAHWSNRRREWIEEEVSFLAQQAFAHTGAWLTTHREWLEDLARHLLIERDVSGAELLVWKQKVETGRSPFPELLPWHPEFAHEGQEVRPTRPGLPSVEEPHRVHRAPASQEASSNPLEAPSTSSRSPTRS